MCMCVCVQYAGTHSRHSDVSTNFWLFPISDCKEIQVAAPVTALALVEQSKTPVAKGLGARTSSIAVRILATLSPATNIYISFLSSCGKKTELEWNDSRSVQTRVLYQNRRAWCIFWSLFEAQVEKELLFQQACERNHVVLNSCSSWKLGVQRDTIGVWHHLPAPAPSSKFKKLKTLQYQDPGVLVAESRRRGSLAGSSFQFLGEWLWANTKTQDKNRLEHRARWTSQRQIVDFAKQRRTLSCCPCRTRYAGHHLGSRHVGYVLAPGRSQWSVWIA